MRTQAARGGLLALLLTLPLAAHSAVQWLRAESPGARPTLVQIGGDDATALALANSMRATGWSCALWRESAPGVPALERMLADGKTVDRSRLVLVARGPQARAAVSLVASLELHGAGSLGVRGLVLQVEGATEWPALPAAGRWPAMLLGYTRDDAAAVRSVLALARRARTAGAAVWLLPMEKGAELAKQQMLSGWLDALDLARSRRFEDALVRTDTGAHLAAVEDALARVATRNRERVVDGTVRVAVADREGGSAELFADEESHLLLRRGAETLREFDARAALEESYGGVLREPAIDLAAALVLVQPETGSETVAIPVRWFGRSGPASALLLRHADGNYGLLDLGEARAVESLMASPDAGDHGHVWWARMDAADARGGHLLRIELQPVLPRRGLWWDPGHAGHALDLQPVPGGYSAVFATYDEAGASRWYLATGRIEGQRFVSGAGGLQLMRRDPAMAPPSPDRALGGRIDIDFAVAAEHPACKRRNASAAQLALLSVQLPGRTESWCIEPVVLPAGVPEHDVNGVWYGGSGDSGWGLSVVSAGDEGRGLVSAMLYFHDREGWPRWAMGAGALGIDGATLTMHGYSLQCRDCRNSETSAQVLGELRLRVGGWCGEPELRARLELGDGDPGLRFQRPEMPLQRISEARCD